MVTRTRSTAPGRRRTILAAAGCALVAFFGFSVLPQADATPRGAAGAVRALNPGVVPTADLAGAYARGRGIPAGAVGAVRPGSVHVAEVPATGEDWAVAAFLPSATASTRVRDGFQDGAGNGVFARPAGGDWKLVQSQTRIACTAAVPAAVKAALGLTAPADCAAGTARPSAAAKAAVAAAAAPKGGTTTAAAATGGGSLGATIASVALGQVGAATTPAETGFSGVDCDPYSTMVAAFSPNADGCGPDAAHRVENQNEAWCSDFAKWVWTQAGVTADLNTLNAGSVSFYAWALAHGENPAADSGTPAVGDAIVFFPPGPISANEFSDHVGIVTAVNADGTVDMVNGDFLGATGITAEYDRGLNLTPWASSVWGQGEQWVLVSPPASAQQPAPSAAVVAPPAAAVGTAVRFAAVAAQPNGSISQYSWTFGDGRDDNTTGQVVSHVFQRAGLYTVTMSATSNLGTVTTKTWNVGVSAPGSAIASVPDNGVWYTTVPVMQYEFTPEGGGGLAVDSWDGAAWLQQTEPGQLAAGSGVTGLTYSDGDAGYATVPHAFYRSAAGTLGESFIGAAGWTASALPGTPAAGSAIAALAADPVSGMTADLDVTPSVFFFDAAGALNVSTETKGTWAGSVLPLPKTASPGALAVAPAAGPLAAESVYYLDGGGRLVSATDVGGHWLALPVPNPLRVHAGTALTAATTDAGTDVFFTDAAGKLAVAGSTLPGQWSVQEIAGSPAAGSTLTATTDLAAGASSDSVYYLTASGAPGVTARTGSTWQASTLPGSATAVSGVSPNVVPGMPEQVFTATGTQLGLDSASGPGAAWSYSALPSTPTSYPGTVLLYAATPQDAATAQAAASFGGLSAGQVTTDFATAWAATLSGNYLVIAVGPAAVNALYDNPCGWANPSADDPGSTPFYNVERPLDVPLTNLFLVAEASTPAQTPTAADDMAYYAVHGALPSGATMPKLAWPGYTCLGTPA